MDSNKQSEDRKKLSAKTCRWLSDYIKNISPGSLSENIENHLFKVIREEFRKLLADDEEFFMAVEDFCSERRTRNEKDAFCRVIVTELVTSGNIQRSYAKKHPDEYRVPEEYQYPS